jgi:diaminohydroxyphosphoribosylaminopyrimidine deaminase / 5-amino-6-(5-phosphoribosylamino)uracil reductase
MANLVETAAMRRALVLACTPSVPLGPNPRVGAVVLDADGRHVGEGFHRGAGGPHAEVEALAIAGHKAQGATVVVTLEPCNHTGRTGPCAQALVDAGVARVVYAQDDPNPLAMGGRQTLAAAGVEVEGGLFADEAADVNQVWTFAMRHRRPFVTWKFATTLDGRSAAGDGTSRWITGVMARQDVQRLRALCDAILVGTRTVEVDDPRLTVRDENDQPWPPSRQPLRVVMGSRDLDPERRVFDDSAATVQLRTHDPREVLADLFARDRQHVWLEGGPTVAAAFLSAGLVDEVIAYVAPALLGSGRNAVAELGVGTISDMLRFELVEVTRVGDDVRITMRGKD